MAYSWNDLNNSDFQAMLDAAYDNYVSGGSTSNSSSSGGGGSSYSSPSTSGGVWVSVNDGNGDRYFSSPAMAEQAIKNAQSQGYQAGYSQQQTGRDTSAAYKGELVYDAGKDPMQAEFDKNFQNYAQQNYPDYYKQYEDYIAEQALLAEQQKKSDAYKAAIENKYYGSTDSGSTSTTSTVVNAGVGAGQSWVKPGEGESASKKYSAKITPTGQAGAISRYRNDLWKKQP